jgi:hypothetical protein
MRKDIGRLFPQALEAARQRRLEATNLQVIENNPLDQADVDMFEREGWDDERCREYILGQVPVAAK